jgi:hypothetical protein
METRKISIQIKLRLPRLFWALIGAEALTLVIIIAAALGLPTESFRTLLPVGIAALVLFAGATAIVVLKAGQAAIRTARSCSAAAPAAPFNPPKIIS